MKIVRMIPDPVTQPEAFDPLYPAKWMEHDIESFKKDNPWLNLCNLTQCVFLHYNKETGKKEMVEGAKITFVTEVGSATFDNIDLAVWWLMCMDGWRVASEGKS